MGVPSTWQELTDRNIKTIQSIFLKANLEDRDECWKAYELAYRMIKDDHFDSVSARWNAFHNALRIVVEGVNVFKNSQEERYQTQRDRLRRERENLRRDQAEEGERESRAE